MPPHRLPPIAAIPSQYWRRGIQSIIVAATLALAGCASTGPHHQQADSSTRTARDNYLAQTKSDPLGQYLASNQLATYSDNPYSSANYPDYSSAAEFFAPDTDDVNLSESAPSDTNFSRTSLSETGFSRKHSHSTIVGTAMRFLGIKYKFGGDTPYTGFDCSGLVAYAAEKSLGLKLPRTSAEIAHEGISIKRTDLKKGDLVFFNTRGRRYSHVGIYLGNEKFVHAPRTGAVVRVEDMNQAYWKKRYNGARRLADSSGKLLGMN